jgi:citronellol/citronellal dehydrogenase
MGIGERRSGMTTLRDKIIFITGSTRGIGREIALKCARDGANIVITGKTVEPHAKLPGTIYSVAKEIETLGGKVLPMMVDVRDESQIEEAVKKAAEHFGGIDILVNNASAISLTDTLHTPMKKYDLMMGVNVRATFAMSQACLPYLKKSSHAHILTLSPPLNISKKWFAPHVAYTMSKYGMSMCTLGMAEEFKNENICINSLWPKTIIATAAIEFNFPKELFAACRKPDIMADAAYLIFSQKNITGNFFIDEEVLKTYGNIHDFSSYALDPAQKAYYPDLFLDA